VGAALHLAHAHQLPPAPKRKRKGGGTDGGDRLGSLVRRIYKDQRADHESKELLLALAYALTTPREDDATAWRTAREALGRDRVGYCRLNALVTRDAPCYKSPVLWSHRHDGELFQLCSAPRLRPFKDKLAGAMQESMLSFTIDLRDANLPAGEQPDEPEEDFRNRLGVCGSHATEYAVEKLPETGWHKVHYFCTRHQGELRKAKARFKEPNAAAPEPVPNWGGLLPCYFDSDWERVYRGYMGERWQPPVYGIRADGWPVPGVEPVPQRARLRLAALDGELLQ